MAIAAQEGIKAIRKYLDNAARAAGCAQNPPRGTFLSNLAALTDAQLRFLDRRLSQSEPAALTH